MFELTLVSSVVWLIHISVQFHFKYY
jgi:hypothetical protein